ncbi:MAG: hypothetical protein JSW71_14125 [Gemmatimonadota bacterium]|nr:MAG: hypothetical protein JSW71_14125 [Gemmatimonadota bacterium]
MYKTYADSQPMFRRLAFGVMVALALAPWPAAPQIEGERAGFWLSFGGGGGLMRDLRAATFYVRMGGTPNRQLQFGGQVMNWWRDEGDEENSSVSVSATAAFFPWDRRSSGGSPLRQTFIRIGFGPVAMGDLSGVGPTFGAGIDLQLGGNLHVTPNVDMAVYFLADHTYTSMAFTLGLTWH